MDKKKPRRHRKKAEIGQRFGRYVVIAEARRRDRRYLLCRCDCGTLREVASGVLGTPDAGSCGCARRDRMTTHGGSGSPEFKAWAAMKRRCQTSSDKEYPNYGGRGISVCPEWEKFEVFLADMGKRPSTRHSLDRIDNDRGYCPDNCRWATWEEQSNNRRNIPHLEYRGRVLAQAEWAQLLGIPVGALKKRLGMGWSVEKTLTTPWKPRASPKTEPADA